MNDNDFHLFAGDGSTIESRELNLPPFQLPSRLTDASRYSADDGLRDAVNVALSLGQPLLLTGEPGTGKTQLAAALAHELKLPLLEFHVKTTSVASDLFYRYDALRHFHHAHFVQQESSIESYIEYQALGLAILLSMDPAEADPFLPEKLRGKGPTRSVVLVDEIDKAPRDLPNDVLNEIEGMEFKVRETSERFKAGVSYRPILVLTSNSEKNLPDAFLRRCVFYHIQFPDRARLMEIVQRRMEFNGSFSAAMLNNALNQFDKIRAMKLNKPPATAECLAWLRILERRKIDVGNLKPGQEKELRSSYSALAKSREDHDKLMRQLGPGGTT